VNAQEEFWSGSFGSEYTTRNRVQWEDRTPFWRQIIQITGVRSVLDVGCNAGWNLLALRGIDETLELWGVDVNGHAVGEARANELNVLRRCAREIAETFVEPFDLVCTSGVLIHVAPKELPTVMHAIVEASKRWVVAVEYEAEQEEEVVYRGNTDKLWKRPFGEMYEAMGLRTVARSEPEGFDRCTAWLMEKRS
jgi:pseudaminic acid biosynthesis-associated methylase